MKKNALSNAAKQALIADAERRYGLAAGTGHASYWGGGERTYPGDLVPPKRSSYGGSSGGAAREGENLSDALERSWTLYRCLVLLADAHSSLRARLYLGAEEEEVTGGQAAELLAHVNPHWDPAMLWGMTSMALDVSKKGCFWILDALDGQGRPHEIWWAAHDTVRPIQGDRKSDKPEDWYVSHYEVKIPGSGSGKPVRYDRERVVWIRTPHPLSELAALSPAGAVLESASMALASLHANKMLFETGMTGAGYVVPAENITWTEEQRQDVAGMFAATVKGQAGWHRVMVANRRDFEVKDLTSLSPKDLQFIQSLTLTASQICVGMGVPEPLLKPTDTTFANAREARKTLWENTVIPRAERIAAAVSSQLLAVHFANEADRMAFDFSLVPELQADAVAKWGLAKDQMAALLGLARDVASGLLSREGALQAAAYYIGAPEDLALAMIKEPGASEDPVVVTTIDLPPLTDLRLLLSGVAEGAVSRNSAIAILSAKTGSLEVARAIVADAGTLVRNVPLPVLEFARGVVKDVQAGSIPVGSGAALLAEALGDRGKAQGVLSDAQPTLALPGPAADGQAADDGAITVTPVPSPVPAAAVSPRSRRRTPDREVIVYRAGEGYREVGRGEMVIDVPEEAPIEPYIPPGEELPVSPYRADDIRAYGSDAHRRAWDDEMALLEKRKARIRKVAERILADHARDAAKGLKGMTADQLRAIAETTVADLDDLSRDDLDVVAQSLAREVVGRAALPRWIERGASQMEAGLRELAADVAADTLGGLNSQAALDLDPDSPIGRALRQRAQAFAESAANTSWNSVARVLERGVLGGSSTKDLAAGISALDEQWQGSRAETIALTETHSASMTVGREAARASGVVSGRMWLTALDERVRESHQDAHGQEVGLDEPYVVGGSACQGPGSCGSPEEDIRCRCFEFWVLED